MPGTFASRVSRAVGLTAMLATAVSACSWPGRAGKSSSPPAPSVAAVTTTVSPFDVTLPSGPALTADSSRPVAPPEETSRPPAVRRGLLTPQAASRNLWDAWRDDDRPRALLYAQSGAVRVLFARPWTPDLVDEGCTIVGLADPGVKGSVDQFTCTYRYLGGAISLSAAGTDRDYSITDAARNEQAASIEPLETSTTLTATTPKKPAATTDTSASGPAA